MQNGRDPEKIPNFRVRNCELGYGLWAMGHGLWELNWALLPGQIVKDLFGIVAYFTRIIYEFVSFLGAWQIIEKRTAAALSSHN